MITSFESLDIKPDDDGCFKHENFYSCLNEKNVSEEDYENVSKNVNLLKLKTLDDLNKTYNFQDTAILCKIFESRATRQQELFKYNPRECNSVSVFFRLCPKTEK